MKRVYLRLLVLVAVMAACSSAYSQEYVKLMSFNVRNTKGLDGMRDYQRVSNVIINCDPDVIAVQELTA